MPHKLRNVHPTTSAGLPAAASALPAGDPAGGETVVVTGAALPTRPYLSIVIPAFNEAQRLPATLTRLEEYLQERDFTAELLVVDDGSRDGTREAVREFAAPRPWVRLCYYDTRSGRPHNRGKGFAIRQGVLRSTGRDVLFSDADLSTPLEEMDKLLGPISRGDCDIAIASRALPDSDLPVRQPWYREYMGRTFNHLVQTLAVPGIQDTQCGFKAFRGQVARHLFALAQIDGFGFDPEILYLARKFGYRIQEIAVLWRHRDASRVSPWRAPLQMTAELVQIRMNDLRGLYGDDDEAEEERDASQ